MNEEPSLPATVVYFDMIEGSGTIPGIAMVELGLLHYVAVSEQHVELKRRTVAHLRCNLNAARALRDTLSVLIDQAENPPPEPAGPAN